MDRKKIFITIAILIIGTVSGGAYWYFTKVASPVSPEDRFPGESATRPVDTAIGPTPEEETEVVFTPGLGVSLPRLYELHQVSVAGVGFTETKDSKGTTTDLGARYIERGLGHIFETPLTTYRESRIVNETRSRIS